MRTLQDVNFSRACSRASNFQECVCMRSNNSTFQECSHVHSMSCQLFKFAFACCAKGQLFMSMFAHSKISTFQVRISMRHAHQVSIVQMPTVNPCNLHKKRKDTRLPNTYFNQQKFIHKQQLGRIQAIFNLSQLQLGQDS